jgi:DNA-binding NarL/FixJ family response regulator
MATTLHYDIGAADIAIESMESALFDTFQPDIVLLSYSGPETRRRVEQIVRLAPSARVCILAGREDASPLNAIVEVGGSACMLERVSLEDVVAMLDRLARRGHAAQRARSAHTLTPREREIGMLVARGFSNRVIAKRLNLSEKTIKNHVSSILSKLQLSSRTQIVIHAMEEGWSAD